jgi:hypothetical protein
MYSWSHFILLFTHIWVILGALTVISKIGAYHLPHFMAIQEKAMHQNVSLYSAYISGNRTARLEKLI